MMVCIGSVLRAVVCIWIMIVAVSGMLISSTIVVYSPSFMYMVISFLCTEVYPSSL